MDSAIPWVKSTESNLPSVGLDALIMYREQGRSEAGTIEIAWRLADCWRVRGGTVQFANVSHHAVITFPDASSNSFVDREKIDGDWPTCCGRSAKFCNDWKPED